MSLYGRLNVYIQHLSFQNCENEGEKERKRCVVNRLNELRTVETIVQWIIFMSKGRVYSFYIRFARLVEGSSSL